MNGGGSAPAAPTYTGVAGSQVAGNISLAPEEIAAMLQYGPQFSGASATNLNDALLGTPSTTGPGGTPGYTNTVTGQFIPQSAIAGGAGGPASNYGVTGPNGSMNIGQWVGNMLNNPNTAGQLVPTTQPGGGPMTTTPGTPGLLSILPQVQSAASGVQTQAQQAQLANLFNLGPSALTSMQNLDPSAAGLMNNLTSQTSNDLASGTALTPAQNRLATNSVAQGQAARGMGFGPTDVYGQALGVSQFGQQMYQQRLQNASNVLGQRNSMYTAPAFGMLTGMPNNGVNNYLNWGTNTAGMSASPFTAPQVNPSDIAGTAYNAQNAQFISGQNNQAALTGAGISGGASVGGALGAAALMALL